MTHSGIPNLNEDALEEIEHDDQEASPAHALGERPSSLPRTLAGLGPAEARPTNVESKPPSQQPLTDTLRFRTRLKPTTPLPPRATRAYQPPTLLATSPSSTPPAEPFALRTLRSRPQATPLELSSTLPDLTLAARRANSTPPEAEASAMDFRFTPLGPSRSGPSEAPWTTSSSQRPPQPKASLRTALVAFAVSVVATVAALLFLLSPKQGGILVTAAGPTSTPIASAEVLVDGQRACSTIPCRVDRLPRGSHLVRVQATGYEPTGSQALSVQSGEHSLIHFNLAEEASAGIDVRVDPAHRMRVILDGTERGPAPLVLHRLSPGPHTLLLSGNPLYAPFEQQLHLEPRQVARVEPKLVPLKAVISLTPGIAALGAWVEILGGGARYVIRKLPARVEVAPETKYRLRATRIGYRDYRTEIRFAGAELEKQVKLDFAWLGAVGTPAQGSAPSTSSDHGPAESEPASEPASDPGSAPGFSEPDTANVGTVGANHWSEGP